MPFVTVKAIEGVFTLEQKQTIIKKVTDVLVEIEGEAMRPITWVVFEDVSSDAWGIGGRAFGTEHVKALQSGEVKLADALGI
ncbi:4-oxalocrotonate tautomerase family protein [Burkholderia sp. A1]|uniref:tautomerase family protein n=1 Tax=unclassified Burkholderia TaxID=2613784 RepID=UPI000468C49A|nr:4-oxalocrotonate tautomerase family protein [Burkholderia sp. A1]NIE83331.1 4-oxalocrotonate tautomerase family protein [Burkholderia sp. Tr-860]NIF62247.1 4-oxalocrotonate tautomerase family protein [Burkholderia sp. Cy-647]NIF72660.1 4-oxalocrotonate tautomerase family protein [Burkholderia sp. Ap-962]NIF94481.1 4-oxalocrotonate tautomerase family protein [Burkholderia sp. Ax-1720]